LEKTGILVEKMLAMRLSRVNNQNLTGWTMRHVFNLEKKKSLTSLLQIKPSKSNGHIFRFLRGVWDIIKLKKPN